MANLETPELENVFSDMPVSTLGSDIAREEASRNTASLVNASRQAGTRGVFSSIPRIQSLNNEANRRNQLELDTRIDRRNELVARDNQRIQGVDENRYSQELAGIGQLMDVGNAQTMAGLRGLMTVSSQYALDNTPQKARTEEVGYSLGYGNNNPDSIGIIGSLPNVLDNDEYLSYMEREKRRNVLDSYKPSSNGLN